MLLRRNSACTYNFIKKCRYHKPWIRIHNQKSVGVSRDAFDLLASLFMRLRLASFDVPKQILTKSYQTCACLLGVKVHDGITVEVTGQAKEPLCRAL